MTHLDMNFLYYVVTGFLIITTVLSCFLYLQKRKQVKRDIAILQSVIDSLPCLCWVKDRHGKYIMINQKFQDATGFTSNDLTIARTTEIDSTINTSNPITSDELILSEEKPCIINTRVSTKHGGTFDAEIYKTRFCPFGTPQGLIGMITDVSKRSQTDSLVQYLSNHDALTKLPNRNSFERALNAKIKANYNGKSELFAVYVLSIDKLQQFNDRFGYKVGDHAMEHIGRSITTMKRSDGLSARLESNRFALLQNIDDRDEASTLGSIYAESLGLNIQYEKVRHSLTCSVGIAVYPQDGVSAQDLLNNAEHALRSIPKLSRNGSVKVTGEDDAENFQVTRIRQAMNNDEFFIVFQPLYALPDTDAPFAYEALLRWEDSHSECVLTPRSFIKSAEVANITNELFNWAITQALADFKRLPSYNSFKLVLNVSDAQLQQVTFAHTLLDTIWEAELTTESIIIDIPEIAIPALTDVSKENITRIDSAGLTVCLDDFGTADSSLLAIRNLPFKMIKIDGQVTNGIHQNEDRKKKLEILVKASKGLECHVVAEGISNGLDLDYLKSKGIEKYQGNIFGSPLAAPGRDGNSTRGFNSKKSSSIVSILKKEDS